MACKDCEDKARDRALTYLTGAERRTYLRCLQNPGPKRPAMEILALGYRRVQADIVVCHRCSNRCGSEGDLPNWNKVHNIHLCSECLDILMDVDKRFCCSCLQNLEGVQVNWAIPPIDNHGGPYFMCVKCLPGGHHRPMDLPKILGGHQFLPNYLGVSA